MVLIHSDQLVKMKRAITGDIVPSAKTEEVGICDGAQHLADENGSIQKGRGPGLVM